ncbi:GtrA family protein [Enterococcus quebecensis]|uniref:GtrA/DPMS transmembrane domain-containing protein n=1 Tax=Enterococcus quebecensis TaxID=903983 RepID=A0A1E5GR64_9ENTE|nr:GtrA family protein [Enterococcus quebecensis]OEG15204.1 hypothetical protein BCR23_10230 [Enterococcus quebecensis]
MSKVGGIFKVFLTRETITYFIFGVLTTLLNVLAFYLLYTFIGIDWTLSNCFAWMIGVTFAFITNKLFVFQSQRYQMVQMIKEVVAFIIARLFSLGVEMVGMFLFIDILLINGISSKIVMGVLVIVINYVLSKLVIFK